MKRLDWALLPDLSYRSSTCGIPDDLNATLAHFPQTRDRARAAIKFCWFAQQADNYLHCTSKESCNQLREAFVRAALSEFVAMEGALERDLTGFSGNAPARKIFDSQNPHLHFIRELRNLQVHLHSAVLKPEYREVQFADPQMRPVAGTQHRSTIWVTAPLTERTLQDLDNAKRYRPEDLSRILEWFNKAQNEWGLPDLVYRAVISYCGEIVKQQAANLS